MQQKNTAIPRKGRQHFCPSYRITGVIFRGRALFLFPILDFLADGLDRDVYKRQVFPLALEQRLAAFRTDLRRRFIPAHKVTVGIVGAAVELSLIHIWQWQSPSRMWVLRTAV